MNDVTRILREIESGAAADSSDELLPLVYDQLRQMAAAKMAHERADHTLDATSLVHEAYLRLAPDSHGWKSRRQFFAAAARAMRRILVDSARSRGAQKRGGDYAKVALDPDNLPVSMTEDQRLLELDAALEEFAQHEPQKAELVRLRYFAGLKINEAAQLLGISTATADRHWAYARAWLQNAVQKGGQPPNDRTNASR